MVLSIKLMRTRKTMTPEGLLFRLSAKTTITGILHQLILPLFQLLKMKK
jgi:hypothetical protein